MIPGTAIAVVFADFTLPACRDGSAVSLANSGRRLAAVPARGPRSRRVDRAHSQRGLSFLERRRPADPSAVRPVRVRDRRRPYSRRVCRAGNRKVSSEHQHGELGRRRDLGRVLARLGHLRHGFWRRRPAFVLAGCERRAVGDRLIGIRRVHLWPRWQPFGGLTDELAIAGAALCVVGLAFAVWARVALGRSWGMPMTQHADPSS